MSHELQAASGQNQALQPHARSQRLLDLVLPPLPRSYADALLHSGSTFKLIDQWFGLKCHENLGIGLTEHRSAKRTGEAPEYELAPLLTLPMAMQLHDSMPMLKAVLLSGYVLGRQETRLLAHLADGVRLSAKPSGTWKAIMPPRLKNEFSLQEALQHCRSHVSTCLRDTAGLHKDKVKWLRNLGQWCDLLLEPAAKVRPVLQDPEISPARQPATREFADPAPAPVRIDFNVDTDGDSDVAAGGNGETEFLLPSRQAPEAPYPEPRALPDPARTLETRASAEARRARTGFRSALENQHLVWVNEQLSPADHSVLVAELKSAFTAEIGETPVAVGLLALAHVTGRLLDQALALSLEPSLDASWLDGCDTLVHRVPTPPDAWTPDARQLALMRSEATHVRLALPGEVAHWLERQLPRDAKGTLGQALKLPRETVEADVREWLAGLRGRTRGLQTLGRVETWLSNALYQARRDHVPLHLLCDTESGHPCPAAYYRAYPSAELSALHRGTLLRAGWSVPDTAAGTGDTGWVGSRLDPHVDAVRAQWASFTAQCEAVAGDAGRPLHERHNARECHEVLLLMFQTLHRVVSDPVESLELLDLRTRRIVIADKQQGDTRAHRVVPLPALAVLQCEEHIRYVRRLAVELDATAPQTAARLRSMLEQPGQRSAPFRFLLDEQHGIVPVTPARLAQAAAGVWTLPLNLGRHFISTWLLEQGASDQAVSSLLGHHDLGTHNLSLLSPVPFEALFGDVRQRLDELVALLGLRSIPGFLAPGSPNHPPRPATKLPAMSFGHEQREQMRRQRRQKIQAEVDAWITEQLAGRPPDDITQDDVARLFARAREASGNQRSYWASERLEAMRDALLALQTTDDGLDLELPAITLSIRDLGHQCPPHGLACARWLRRFRKALHAFWAAEIKAWRAARSSGPAPHLEALVLTLVVDSLLVDPEVWRGWNKGHTRLEVFLDDAGLAWVRAGLPSGNSRLYPVRRVFAEMVAGVDAAAWRSCSLASVTRLANTLDWQGCGMAPLSGFDALLARVLAGTAADAPGLVLGFAGGAHGSVSPEGACLERAGGLPPTQAAVDAWGGGRATPEDEPEEEGAALPMKRAGRLRDEALFRERMSLALRLMDRSAAARARVQERRGAVPGGSPSAGRELRPMRRFTEAIEAQSADLLHSPALPPMCGLAAQWMYRLAKLGQKGGRDYAPKTLRNYWSSWALRAIEEFGAIDPAALSADELEGLYLQIAEDAEVESRQHLYAPMRSLHRHLVVHHGVCEINWHALQQATQQGLARVDANLVHEHEYFRALAMLRADGAMPARVRAMQAAVLVLLFRFGLRIAECLGLRAGDVVFDADRGRWRVLVRANRYRALKTESARRCVVQIESLGDQEHEALSNWVLHVQHHAGPQEVQPLFSAGSAGQDRADLFPRRLITLRIVQALRSASGDPSVRIHHCRHAYATRLLGRGLQVRAAMPATPDAEGSNAAGTLHELTSEERPSRRFVWAVASLMGHASPATTLQSYFHGGHLLLRHWCETTLWPEAAELDGAEGFAFATGTSLRTLQRALQRSRAAGDIEPSSNRQPPLELARKLWSRIDVLGSGPRVSLPLTLPPLALLPQGDAFHSADAIIEHWRRFGRVDGLAERLHVTEPWIEHVLRAAASLTDKHRTSRTPPDQRWVEATTSEYPEHERYQVQQALQRLQPAPKERCEEFAGLIERCLVPAARMLVIETIGALEQAVDLAGHILGNSRSLVLLVPAKTSGRGASSIRPTAKASAQGIESENVFELAERARQLGLMVEVHGRVAGARDSSHNWLRPGDRVGLTVKRDQAAPVRSARTYARILAVAAVAWRAQQTLAQAASAMNAFH
ncbi:site-specific integrase [Azohydromonas aeria]|uniref:site-specific integrase n=1 Tax=Azohydromonas aeria TaxID=2590212 RepID=UPI0012F9D384|nr:site-specific integrase [Azohydromonas aeria]